MIYCKIILADVIVYFFACAEFEIIVGHKNKDTNINLNDIKTNDTFKNNK